METWGKDFTPWLAEDDNLTLLADAVGLEMTVDETESSVGDFVLVPAGKDNHEAVVEVVNIEYFGEENVPLPIEKTKRIIRKCTDEDFVPPVA